MPLGGLVPHSVDAIDNAEEARLEESPNRPK
jgi:hypothetical protein